jgi:hypothetical protein
MKARPTTFRHPLTDFVLGNFVNRECQDYATLATDLSGTTFFRGRRSIAAPKAYRLVAEDVLSSMEKAGLVVKDAAGWFRLPKVEAPPA